MEAFDAYNETALQLGLPQAAKLTPDRERKIVALLKAYGPDGWRKALANLQTSDFLRGRTDHGFRASLDFMLQRSSFNKLHDGAYARVATNPLLAASTSEPWHDPNPFDDLHAEQVLIGHAMADPAKIQLAREKPTASDFVHERHADIWQIMCSIADAGHAPGLQSILARIGSNADAEPGFKAKDYLLACAKASVQYGALWLPFDDCLDAVRERSQRRSLARIGSALTSASAVTTLPLADVIGATVQELDDVASSLRAGKGMSYDGHNAATAAIDHAMGGKSDNPTTGMDDLDTITGGWPRGQLTIIAARPGMGKSALATSLMRSAGRRGVAQLMFSFEMTREQIGGRLLCDLAYQQRDPIHYERLWRGEVDQRQMQRLDEARRALEGLPLHFEEHGITISDVAARARKLANELARKSQRLEVIHVDHLGLVRPSSRYAGNHERETAEQHRATAGYARQGTRRCGLSRSARLTAPSRRGTTSGPL